MITSSSCSVILDDQPIGMVSQLEIDINASKDFIVCKLTVTEPVSLLPVSTDVYLERIMHDKFYLRTFRD